MLSGSSRGSRARRKKQSLRLGPNRPATCAECYLRTKLLMKCLSTAGSSATKDQSLTTGYHGLCWHPALEASENGGIRRIDPKDPRPRNELQIETESYAHTSKHRYTQHIPASNFGQIYSDLSTLCKPSANLFLIGAQEGPKALELDSMALTGVAWFVGYVDIFRCHS